MRTDFFFRQTDAISAGIYAEVTKDYILRLRRLVKKKKKNVNTFGTKGQYNIKKRMHALHLKDTTLSTSSFTSSYT